MLNCRLSELYGKDDKEDRDDESGIPGIPGKHFCGHHKLCSLIVVSYAVCLLDIQWTCMFQ